MRSRRTRAVDTMRRKRREGWLQHCSLSHDQACCLHPPFVECYAVQVFSIASNLDPKLMPKEQYQITMRKVCIDIQFWLQLGSRETPHASHSGTVAKRCPRRNQRRATRAVWVRCEPLTPRCDPRKDEPAHSSRRRAQPFLPSHCHSECNQTCLPGPLWSSSREETSVSCKPPIERELGIVQEARTWRPIPMEADLLPLPVVRLTERVRSGACY